MAQKAVRIEGVFLQHEVKQGETFSGQLAVNELGKITQGTIAVGENTFLFEGCIVTKEVALTIKGKKFEMQHHTSSGTWSCILISPGFSSEYIKCKMH